MLSSNLGTMEAWFSHADYRNSLYRHCRRQGRGTVTSDVFQKVVYIGSPTMRMISDLKRKNLDFSYSFNDIRWFWSDWKDRLVRSTLPLNWIQTLICSDVKDELMWTKIASGVRQTLDQNGSQSDLALPAVLLVASTLRNMSDDFRRGIINMFTMNVERDPLFRKIYEQGNARAAKARILRIISIGLDARAITLEETQNEV